MHAFLSGHFYKLNLFYPINLEVAFILTDPAGIFPLADTI